MPNGPNPFVFKKAIKFVSILLDIFQEISHPVILNSRCVYEYYM